MAGLSQRAYARHRGVTHRAVQKAIEAGRITRNPDGTIDPEKADAQWATNSDPASPARNKPPVPKPRAKGSTEYVPPPTGGYLASRAVREAYRARREKLAYERESGAVIPVDEAARMWEDVIARMRARMIASIGSFAPRAVGLRSVKEANALLEEAVYSALSNAMAAPPPKLRVSEWADLYRYLPKESSPEPGKWSTDRAPYQRGMMDALTDPDVQVVIYMTSVQVGKTETINN